jgi:L-asparaginase/Glu-tRNA(Gln) amidotransferase subunit D
LIPPALPPTNHTPQAFTLDITLSCTKPIIIVGAMRPSTATSADGPANLLEAVTVAIDPRAKGRGALIVMNDRIGQAWYTIKRNANVLETFGAPEQGYVGGLLSYTPFWYWPAMQVCEGYGGNGGRMGWGGVDVTVILIDVITAYVQEDVQFLVDCDTACGRDHLRTRELQSETHR